MTRLLTVLVLLPALGLAACGSDDDGGAAPAPPEPMSAAEPADFPAAKGKTLAQLTADKPEGAILALAVSQLKVGENRVAFALFDRARKQMDVAAVAAYTARTDGSDLRGPYVARKESLRVDPQYRSAQTEADLASGDAFYVARVPFEERGQRQVVGLARLDGRLVAANPLQPATVGSKNGPPEVGDEAIDIHTLTAADVGGDLEKITTRIPPAEELLKTDFADVRGKKPAVLLFATPALCASRTCGPVVDIAEQVRAQSGEGVEFIQQEIYVDNNPSKGFREQVSKWRLPTEPWAYVIDRSGKVAARFEGVFSVGELARAVEKVK
ncbi:MAG: hypothetical protein H0T43_03610 [Solirubrobacterales bacterium]|nr:hypothetical protein [Solirubrobacterales bacterium]